MELPKGLARYSTHILCSNVTKLWNETCMEILTLLKSTVKLGQCDQS